MAASQPSTINRELLRTLVSRELRGQYRGSVLGWMWSLLNPLAMVAIYSLVFGVVFKQPPPVGKSSGLSNFPLFLVCGLVPWNLFAVGITGAASSLTAQAPLISKVYFPRVTVVLAKLIAGAVMSAIEFAVVIVALLIAGNMVLPWLPVLVLLFAIELLLILGIGLLLSVANVYFRDVQYLLTIGTQVLFYLTPIIYPLSFLDGRDPTVLFLYRLNPMMRLVGAFRAVLYDLEFPNWVDVGYVAVFSVVLTSISWRVFRRLEPRLAEEL